MGNLRIAVDSRHRPVRRAVDTAAGLGASEIATQRRCEEGRDELHGAVHKFFKPMSFAVVDHQSSWFLRSAKMVTIRRIVSKLSL